MLRAKKKALGMTERGVCQRISFAKRKILRANTKAFWMTNK
jgi:hypothetical protein